MSGNDPMAGGTWRTLGRADARTLTETRLQMHWAVQALAAAANALVEKRPDDSHSNLGWQEELRALVSHPLTGEVRAAVAVEDPALLLLDGPERVSERLALHGLTLDAATEWLARVVASHAAARGASLPSASFALPDYDMPDHAVRSGHPFTLERNAATAELARWFGNASLALEAVAAAEPDASPVRCWPHHFDIGTLIVLDPARGAEHGPSIGAGLSPGDGVTGEPYFYVNPYPRPEAPSLPRLEGGGSWHTESWFGAILTASRVTEHPTAAGQSGATGEFLGSAVRACLGWLGGRNGPRSDGGSG